MFEYQIKEKCLHGKTILVTGAGDGIGKAASIQYAKLGATVILLGRTVAKLEQVYDEIIAQNSPEPVIMPLDLKTATSEQYDEITDAIIEQFTKLDGVLLNASVLGDLTPFMQIKEPVFDEVMQVNVKAQFLLTQALIPALLLSESSSIVFTTSGVGNQGRAYWGTYSISKFATEGMMEVIADEYDNSTLRCNAINPGATRTSMRAQAYPAEDTAKLATTTDIMPAYVYLMSEDSKAITGQVIKAQ